MPHTPLTPSHTHPHTLTGDAEWRSVAYGAPCLQLMRLTTEHNSPFKMKIVMAEVESGEGGEGRVVRGEGGEG